jgi:uncharacterized DUF497 family protein
VPPTIVSQSGDYEWDAVKADGNRKKHGISFEEAATTLAHPGAAVFDDGRGEGRLVAVGLSYRERLLTVVHEPRGARDRIISAWRSTPQERRLYMTRGA